MRQVILEVERKFCGLAVAQLTANAGTPGFRNLQHLGEQRFSDTYYDRRSQLSSGGVWLRRRQHVGKEALWEAKVRKGGTFNNSMFEELTDTAAIANQVRNLTGQAQAASEDFGLEKIAHLVTSRRSWLADDQFKIVLDLMDFGHEVGEIELERKLDVPSEMGSMFDVETWKRSISRNMDDEIEAFIQRYSWAFTVGAPAGKLTAFFNKQQQ